MAQQLGFTELGVANQETLPELVSAPDACTAHRPGPTSCTVPCTIQVWLLGACLAGPGAGQPRMSKRKKPDTGSVAPEDFRRRPGKRERRPAWECQCRARQVTPYSLSGHTTAGLAQGFARCHMQPLLLRSWDYLRLSERSSNTGTSLIKVTAIYLLPVRIHDSLHLWAV